jgi:hypothetical protein
MQWIVAPSADTLFCSLGLGVLLHHRTRYLQVSHLSSISGIKIWQIFPSDRIAPQLVSVCEGDESAQLKKPYMLMQKPWTGVNDGSAELLQWRCASGSSKLPAGNL